MARLICEHGPIEGQSFDIGDGLTIGRGTHHGIAMPKDPKASRDHAKVWKAGPNQYNVADLGSTNGTLLNNSAVTRGTLREGDMLQVGLAVFRFELDEAERPKPKAPAAKASSGASGGRQDLAAVLRGEAKPEPKATDGLGIEVKERILQYSKKDRGGTVATSDIGQMAMGQRWLMYAVGLAVAIGLFMAIKGVMGGGEVEREGQRPSATSGE